MSRFFKKRDAVLGRRPGELVYIGRHGTTALQSSITRYNDNTLQEQHNVQADKISLESTADNTWINIDGIADSKAMNTVKSKLDLDMLIAADIMNTGTRPKALELGDNLFLVVKMLSLDPESRRIFSEQVSLYVTDTHLVTFQEAPGDVFDTVRERLKDETSLLRHSGVDYLAFSLLDSIVDNYIHIIQNICEAIEILEEKILEHPNEHIIKEIVFHKKELLYLRKSIVPFKDAMKKLLIDKPTLIRKSEKFHEDLYSNLLHIVDTIDIYREITTQLQSTYDSYMNNRLNEIMKYLTLFSVIFLPLSLITGIYGTNFDIIPELHFQYGYALLWGIIILIAAIMIIVFKKKKWF